MAQKKQKTSGKALEKTSGKETRKDGTPPSASETPKTRDTKANAQSKHTPQVKKRSETGAFTSSKGSSPKKDTPKTQGSVRMFMLADPSARPRHSEDVSEEEDIDVILTGALALVRHGREVLGHTSERLCTIDATVQAISAAYRQALIDPSAMEKT